MRQRAGGLTAIDGLRAERMCADNVQDVRRERSGNPQTTEVSAKFKSAVSVRCVSVHVTANETLRGERMCTNSGRIYRNAGEIHNVDEFKASTRSTSRNVDLKI